MFSILNIVSLFAGLLPIATQIGKLWESSAGFGEIAKVLANSSATKDLETWGASMFPAVAKSVQNVLAALHLGYPQSTAWIQKALNAGQSLGYIHFGDPLQVDGKFGQMTYAAVVVLQAKLGLKATGAVQDAEYKALNLLLAGKTP